MFAQLFRNWWVFLVRGLFAITFGILALVWTEQAKLALVVLFGAFALADGIFASAAGIALRGFIKRWWILLLEGMTGIAIGVITFLSPDITALVLLYFIAAWAVITGILEILAAIQFRRVLSSEWSMILGGMLSGLLGVLLFAFPAAGAVSLVWVIGLYTIFAGLAEIVFAIRLRSLSQGISRVVASGI